MAPDHNAVYFELHLNCLPPGSYRRRLPKHSLFPPAGGPLEALVEKQRQAGSPQGGIQLHCPPQLLLQHGLVDMGGMGSELRP